MSVAPYVSGVVATDFHPETREFFSGRRVVVTGGSGFIGSHVVEQLLTLGAVPAVVTRQSEPRFLAHLRGRVDVRVADLEDFEATRKAFDGADVVINMAARV